MDRCIWCHSTRGDLRPLSLQDGRQTLSGFVHPDHEAAVRHWHQQAHLRGNTLIVLLVLLPLGLLAALGAAALVSRRLLLPAAGLAILGLGSIVARFPFPTPQTITLLGLQRAIRLVRTLSVLVITLGAALAGLGIWFALRAT